MGPHRTRHARALPGGPAHVGFGRSRATSAVLVRPRLGPVVRIAPRPHRSRTRERFLGGIRLPAGRPNVRYLFSPFHCGPYNLLVSCRPRIMPLVLLVFHSTFGRLGPSPSLGLSVSSHLPSLATSGDAVAPPGSLGSTGITSF